MGTFAASHKIWTKAVGFGTGKFPRAIFQIEANNQLSNAKQKAANFVICGLDLKIVWKLGCGNSDPERPGPPHFSK
jgi:hypothetical protein